MAAYMLRLVKVSEKIVYFYSIAKGWEANNQTNTLLGIPNLVNREKA